MAAVEGVRIGGEDGPIRKKPKISDLPVSSAKRSTVDGLLHVFKKKGEFDSLRKKIYAQFEQGDAKTTLLNSLRTFTDEEIERDPVKYLGKDRRLAAPLLEGAAARADIYPATEANINQYISTYLDQAEKALREARRKELGEDAAREEQQKGAKSDDDYAAEAQVRRLERAKQHLEVMKLKKKKEKDEARKRELEALKKRAMELTKEKEKLEREHKRRTEREAARARQKAMEEERRKKFAEEREKKEKEAAEAAKKAEEERERRRKEQEAAEAKQLEHEAMRMLLKEGERLTEKTSLRPDRTRGSSPDMPSRRGPLGRTPRLGGEVSARGGTTRSPTPERSVRRSSIREEDDRVSRTKSPRRESILKRDVDTDRAGRRDGGSVRHRSRSPPHRRWRDDSRSPPPRRRDRSWSRTPPRRAYRDRDYSPPRRRRSRSRSPPDIDRYVPSGRRDDRRDRDKDKDRGSDRDREKGRDRERERDRDRRDRDRDRDRPRDRDRDRSDRDNDQDRRKRRDSSIDRRRSTTDRTRSRSR